jgi:cytidylate kinase
MAEHQRIPVITIDGPSGSGKGTIARLIARQLDFHFLDSGALYRVLALLAVRRGVALDDAPAQSELAAEMDIRFPSDTVSEQVLLQGQDVSNEIRSEEVGSGASKVAALPEVRAALLQRQRDFAVLPGLVADGRDMGTVVFPEADAKIFLTASAEERARRRYKQLKEKNISAEYERILADVQARDERDSNRPVAPLRPAADAFELDTSDLNIPATVQCARDFIYNRLNL